MSTHRSFCLQSSSRLWQIVCNQSTKRGGKSKVSSKVLITAEEIVPFSDSKRLSELRML